MPEGESYSGDFVDGEFTGTGSYQAKGGEKYTGEFENWRYHGEGTRITNYGAKYFGKFVDGELQGKGEYRQDNGSSYKGEFEYGEFNGKGEYIDDKGNRYIGNFKQGKFHGEGELFYAEPLDGISHFTGEWKYGRVIKSDMNPAIKTAGDNNEFALYNQHHLLNQQIAELKAGDPNKTEFYQLSVAGDGNQEVFRREIQFIDQKFEDEFNVLKSQQITLINSRQTVEQYPMASRTSIRSSLQAISEKMNIEDDILFLYMSSHGSPSFDFSLNQERMTLTDIAAKELKDYLAELPIKWKVIVISACYSGGFIDELKDDHTLIITSASHDKTSFGCADENTFTYFGRAFFKESLTANSNFGAAFEQAKALIHKWEEEQEVTHSEPQIHQPKAIMEKLKHWQGAFKATKPNQ